MRQFPFFEAYYIIVNRKLITTRSDGLLPMINEIVLRKRGITADTALRLARYFGTTADFWLNLQTGFEKETALRGKTAATLAAIVPFAKSKTQRITAA